MLCVFACLFNQSFYTFTKQWDADLEKTVIGTDKRECIIYQLKKETYCKHKAYKNMCIAEVPEICFK